MNIWVITKRELGAFLVSPLVYLTGAAFLFVTGLFFVLEVVVGSAAALTQVFQVTGVLLLGLAPLLTMRLLSEEARSGTLELLLTAPVREGEVVIGKFLAAFLWFIALLAPTLVYVFLLLGYGSLNISTILTGYLGVILLGAMVLSMGMLTSAIFATPLKAATLGFALTSALWLVGWSNLAYMSPQPHFFDMAQGLGNFTDIVYFLSMTTATLFLSAYVLASKRGRHFNIIFTVLVCVSLMAALYLVVLEQGHSWTRTGRFGLVEVGQLTPQVLTQSQALSRQTFCLTSAQMAATILTTLILMPGLVLATGGAIWWKRR